jgi:hypothetical protein
MNDGIASPNIPTASALVDVLGNAMVGSIPSTVRVPFGSVVLQIMANPAMQGQTSSISARIDQEVAALQASLDQEVAALESSIEAAAAGTVRLRYWPELLATPGTRVGQPGEVTIGGSTHIDPVSALSVADKGEYTWTGSAWAWAGELLDPAAVQAAIDALSIQGYSGFDTFDESITDRIVITDNNGLEIFSYEPPAVANAERLKQIRMRIRKIKRGIPDQLIIGLIGDSWTDAPGMWNVHVSAALKAAYGDAGLGYLGFGSGGAIDAGYTSTESGTWVVTNYVNPTPDTSIFTSSTVGSRRRVTGPAAPVLSAAKLFYMATADGVVRYRWNDGTWSANLSLAETGLKIAALTGFPTSGAWSFDVEVVSGTVILGGVEFQSAATGVRVHKLGKAGSTAKQWAALDGKQWKAGMTSLGLHAAVILHGTNDNGYAFPPGQFRSDLNQIADRLKSALNTPDLFFVAPFENMLTGKPYPMNAHARAMRGVADEQWGAMLNLQHVVGRSVSDYDTTAAFSLMEDIVHPNVSFGGPLIADAILGVIDPSL